MRISRVLQAAVAVGASITLMAVGTPATAAGSNLTYHGGPIDPTPAIYLVYWGKQWQTPGDLSRTIPYEQAFFNGLYGPGDTWTTSTQQYCSGAPVGATSCGAGTTHVGTPSGGLIKGIWFDNALPSPPAPTQTLFAQEAIAAAAHFGNTTSASNASVEYIIHTPKGFNDPEFGAVYCAWHSWTSSSYGNVAYTNIPYMPDMPFTCGANAVNSGGSGNLDGVSIVGGHEFAEVITDPFPNSGWLDSAGQENADKCAWITSGPGAMYDLYLSTGTFAVQSLWSNSAGGCV
jgi:serine protease